jgi:hypothetical protein
MHGDYRTLYTWHALTLLLLHATFSKHISCASAMSATEATLSACVTCESQATRRASSVSSAETTVYNSYIISDSKMWTVSDFSEQSALRKSLDLGYKIFILREFNDFFQGKTTTHQRRLAAEPLHRVEFRGSTELLEDSIVNYLMMDVPCPTEFNATCQAVYGSFTLSVESSHSATNVSAMAQFVGDSLTYQTGVNVNLNFQPLLVQAGFDPSLQVFEAVSPSLSPAIGTNAPSIATMPPTQQVGVTLSAVPTPQSTGSSAGETIQPTYQTIAGAVTTMSPSKASGEGDLVQGVGPSPSSMQPTAIPTWSQPNYKTLITGSPVEAFIVIPAPSQIPAANNHVASTPSLVPTNEQPSGSPQSSGADESSSLSAATMVNGNTTNSSLSVTAPTQAASSASANCARLLPLSLVITICLATLLAYWQ